MAEHDLAARSGSLAATARAIPMCPRRVPSRSRDGVGQCQQPSTLLLRRRAGSGRCGRPRRAGAPSDSEGGAPEWAGYIDIVDRVTDMIISGGENVYSAEVENILYTHPDVLEAAVIGVPDDTWGERVRAVVVPRRGASCSPAQLIEHCRSKLGCVKIPRTVDLRADPLPESGAGKILKRDLREPYWAGRERGVN
ncbi:hypothetical protein [Pseudonocardia sp. WMMC193]|uniref:AMP-binding enzyme n=1 Tax=Pseudonocardia sp. WMMC193 TaxID=2911965 RepID=UPI001F2F5DA3|nr:hypothetical protein [Pseudonocardia sp. WMMC193]MCF7550746.1 hypothetical protein [Pseudonocardia sp. WMMC193]